VWGVLGINRGIRKLTRAMAPTPPAGRARARRYGAATSRMSPRDTRGTWWCQGSASKPPDGCVCTWEWSHQTHKWVYPTIEPKNDPNGARGAEIWLLKVGRCRRQKCLFAVNLPNFQAPILYRHCMLRVGRAWAQSWPTQADMGDGINPACRAGACMRVRAR
jgi:hypothetical protein